MIHKDSDHDLDSPIPEQQHGCDTLKTKLASTPILALLKENRPFMIDTDASKFASGVVLLQKQDEGNLTHWVT